VQPIHTAHSSREGPWIVPLHYYTNTQKSAQEVQLSCKMCIWEEEGEDIDPSSRAGHSPADEVENCDKPMPI